MSKRLFLFLAIFALPAGCARLGSYPRFNPVRAPSAIEPAPYPITCGKPHPQLDKAEAFVHTPIAKWRAWVNPDEPPRRIEERRREAVEVMQRYLERNDLTDIYIDVHEYSPSEQWRRLKENNRVHPIWKYTNGTLSHLRYTFLPGRVFRYNMYNPYTNTLNIHSARASRALFEAGEVKFIRARRFPGTYLALRRLPLVPIVQDIRVGREITQYAREIDSWELEKEIIPMVYGKIGAGVVSETTNAVFGADLPFYFNPLAALGGRLIGNTSGRIALRRQERQISTAENE
jgi:hypothetical protein